MLRSRAEYSFTKRGEKKATEPEEQTTDFRDGKGEVKVHLAKMREKKRGGLNLLKKEKVAGVGKPVLPLRAKGKGTGKTEMKKGEEWRNPFSLKNFE